MSNGDIVIPGTSPSFLGESQRAWMGYYAAPRYHRAIEYQWKTIDIGNEIQSVKAPEVNRIQRSIANEQKNQQELQEALQKAKKAGDAKKETELREQLTDSKQTINALSQSLQTAGDHLPKVKQLERRAFPYNRAISQAREALVESGNSELASLLGEEVSMIDKTMGTRETATSLTSQSMFSGIMGIAA